MREAFQVFDREGNGFITTPDLLEVMQTIGDMLSSDEAQVTYPRWNRREC